VIEENVEVSSMNRKEEEQMSGGKQWFYILAVSREGGWWWTPLPPQRVVLTATENKIELVEIICQNLKERGEQFMSNYN